MAPRQPLNCLLCHLVHFLCAVIELKLHCVRCYTLSMAMPSSISRRMRHFLLQREYRLRVWKAYDEYYLRRNTCAQLDTNLECYRIFSAVHGPSFDRHSTVIQPNSSVTNLYNCWSECRSPLPSKHIQPQLKHF
ncbi:hypothetical protein P692DRAFT_20212417 [Suillus brevipes Sb2]|nr:hypothetical protein P692DRAFT_20212417 [Suillus brevipes Sb2]